MIYSAVFYFQHTSPQTVTASSGWPEESFPYYFAAAAPHISFCALLEQFHVISVNTSLTVLYCSLHTFPAFTRAYVCFFTCCADLLPSLSTLFQVAGFFKGMSFPLASITVYNSAVFGFFSNTQRLISNYRYGDGRHPCSMLDMTVASMLTGLMSVSLGAPVDLVKIRLQMQTQMVLAGNVGFAFFRSGLFVFFL